MSLLIVHLPPHPRWHPARVQTPASEAEASVAEVDFVFSEDGQHVDERGRVAPALLPGLRRGTTQVVAVLSECALAWHHVTLPKAPAARLRQALIGLIEERLLDEPQALHFALAPDLRPGEAGWVVATDRPWLAGQLEALARAGVDVERIVPVTSPQRPPLAHFETRDESADGYAQSGFDAAGMGPAEDPPLSLSWSHADGVLQWPLVGASAHTLTPDMFDGARCTATPAASLGAEHWLGRPLAVLSTAERWLAAAQGPWNLRQFELAARHRGVASVKQAWQTWLSPAWRPVRWGIALLVALQVVGLNVQAWQAQRHLRDLRGQMTALLRTTHPQVQAVLDAPIQMARETETLRAAAGELGDADLERLLQAAAAAWPEGLGVDELRFEAGHLTLHAAALGPPQGADLQTRLQSAGWRAEVRDGELQLWPSTGAAR